MSATDAPDVPVGRSGGRRGKGKNTHFGRRSHTDSDRLENATFQLGANWIPGRFTCESGDLTGGARVDDNGIKEGMAGLPLPVMSNRGPYGYWSLPELPCSYDISLRHRDRFTTKMQNEYTWNGR
jgi:hypothetical protein